MCRFLIKFALGIFYFILYRRNETSWHEEYASFMLEGNDLKFSLELVDEKKTCDWLKAKLYTTSFNSFATKRVVKGHWKYI